MPHLLGRRVASCTIYRRDVLIAPGDPPGGFSRARRGRRSAAAPVSDADMLVGLTIVELRRHGKQLAIIGGNQARPSGALVVQLGMTGHLSVHGSPSPAAPVPPHTHARWTLETGDHFDFVDARRFGGLRVFRSLGELADHWSGLGPDGLVVSGDHLSSALGDSTRCIKAALLDQAMVAGVGNIYADESLFLAGIRPQTRCRRIRRDAWDGLAENIREVLASAVNAGGSTLRDYADANGAAGRYQGQHRVYGRQDEPCVRCGLRLRSCVLAQRMTVWCPACQR